MDNILIDFPKIFKLFKKKCYIPFEEKEFIITTNENNFFLGAIVSQGTEGRNLPNTYACRNLNLPEQKLLTIQKELSGIVWQQNSFVL